DQQPWSVADHGDGLTCTVYCFRELLGFRHNAESVCVEGSSWKEESVKLRWINLVQTLVCPVLLRFVVMLECLNLAAFWRDDGDLCSGFFQCFFGFCELGFFYPVGEQYCNA